MRQQRGNQATSLLHVHALKTAMTQTPHTSAAMLLSVPAPSPPDASWILSARRAVETEHRGLGLLLEALDGPLGTAFCRAIETLRAARGRVIASGMGKSGIIARKIAATLSSTGTPALFVHPAEASHGDLGMITPDDVVLMISNSGETPELKDMLAYTRRFAVPLIAITTKPDSAMARSCDVALILPAAPEACPIGLAPTTSTLLQMALGDALAVTLLDDKGFSARDFHSFHPGGRLGAALTHVGAVMHKVETLPLALVSMPMMEALVAMTAKSFGCLGVVDEEGRLIGLVTDGDLRRKMSADLLHKTVGDIMNDAPRTIDTDMLALEALEQLNANKITSLFVVDEAHKPVGLVHIHDLLRMGVS